LIAERLLILHFLHFPPSMSRARTIEFSSSSLRDPQLDVRSAKKLTQRIAGIVPAVLSALSAVTIERS